MTEVIGFSQGITDYGDEDIVAEEAMTAVPGDMLVHHSMIVHRADANLSDRTRRALGFVYWPQRAKQDTERADAYRKQLTERWTREGKL